MADEIEKIDDNVFMNREGDIISADDARITEDVDVDRIKSSRERADQMMRVRPREPTLEDELAVDAVFEKGLADIDQHPGASVSLRKRAKAMTRIARYYEAGEYLFDMDKDAKSFKTNKFNQAYSKSEMMHHLADAEAAFIENKGTYDDDVRYLARIKQLLGEGLTPDDLQILHASRVDTRADVERLRKGGDLVANRLAIINRIRANAGLDPIEPKVPDHLKNDFVPKPVAPVELAEDKTGCDCDCPRCDGGGGLHCHNERTLCYI